MRKDQFGVTLPTDHFLRVLALVMVNAFFSTLQMFSGIGKVKSIGNQCFLPPPGILFYSLPFHFSGFRRYFLHQFFTFVCNRLANSNDGFQSTSLRGRRIKNRFNVNSFIYALMGIMHGPAQYTPDLCGDAHLHLAGIKSVRI